VIAIIDYKMGNVRSVESAFERLGFEAEITPDLARIEAADAVVLPGVGAFGEGMDNLRAGGHDVLLRRLADEGRPLLGICLGLQLFFSWSEEHGRHEGLGLFEGGVVRFREGLTVPHMGWNQVDPTEPRSPLFDDIPDGSHFYFAHSYYVSPDSASLTAATTDYEGAFTSVAAKGSVFGVQFHPEKSAVVGERMLANFARRAGVTATC